MNAYGRSMGGGYPQSSSNQVVPCTNCFRTFNQKTLIEHEKVCRPVPTSAKGGHKGLNGLGSSQSKGIFDKAYNSNPQIPDFSQGRQSAQGSYSNGGGNIFSQGGGYGGGSKEKAISCSVCLNKVPVSQLQKHEIECRQNSMNKKKGGSRVVGGGGAMNRTGFSSTRPAKKEPEPEYVPPKMIQRPISLMCYICGKEYGTKSLPIHLRTCQQKWDNEQSLKPAKDRRPMPRAPPGFDFLLAKDNITRKDIDNYNNRAFDQYNYDVLVPCESCGRTFKPESLIPHQKSCKPNNPLKPMSKAQQEFKQEQMYAREADLDLVPCSKCNRRFASDRINKHQSVCKPGPTKQAIKKQKALEIKKQKLEKNDRYYEQKAGQNNWRSQHEEFQNQLKYMRKVGAVEKKGGDVRGIAPPPKTRMQSNMKQCPHCLRNFSDEAATRHIPACKNTINRPKPSPASILAKQQQMEQQYSSKPSYGGGSSYNSYGASSGGAANKRAASYNKPSYDNNYDDDYEQSLGGSAFTNKYTSPQNKYGGGSAQKTYKIGNSNVSSVNVFKGSSNIGGSGLAFGGSGDRFAYQNKPMGSKYQKTHDMLYGIGAYSGGLDVPQVGNGANFPAPKGMGGGGFR